MPVLEYVTTNYKLKLGNMKDDISILLTSTTSCRPLHITASNQIALFFII
jgi:hypothetical protein